MKPFTTETAIADVTFFFLLPLNVRFLLPLVCCVMTDNIHSPSFHIDRSTCLRMSGFLSRTGSTGAWGCQIPCKAFFTQRSKRTQQEVRNLGGQDFTTTLAPADFREEIKRVLASYPNPINEEDAKSIIGEIKVACCLAEYNGR